MELAVFAGVVEWHIRVRALVAVVHFAHVEWLGIDVDTDCALIEFRKIEHLVHRFERIDVGRMIGVHFVCFCGSEMAGAVGCVAIFNAEILYF